jgi:hypothetical protein
MSGLKLSRAGNKLRWSALGVRPQAGVGHGGPELDAEVAVSARGDILRPDKGRKEGSKDSCKLQY